MRAPIGMRCLSNGIPGPPGFRPPAPVPAPQLQRQGRRCGGNPGTPAHPCPPRRRLCPPVHAPPRHGLPWDRPGSPE